MIYIGYLGSGLTLNATGSDALIAFWGLPLVHNTIGRRRSQAALPSSPSCSRGVYDAPGDAACGAAQVP